MRQAASCRARMLSVLPGGGRACSSQPRTRTGGQVRKLWQSSQPATPPQPVPPAIRAMQERQVARVRSSLITIFTEFNPKKLDSVERLLQEWAGREEALLTHVALKYGGEQDSDAASAAPASPGMLSRWWNGEHCLGAARSPWQPAS